MAESLLLSDLERTSQRVWLANAARKESHEWHHHPTPKLMSEEIFDVVNQEDAIVGQAPRSTVHAENLLHRAVHVLVFHEDGRLFLQKRSMTKDCFPGTWDSSASGHLDKGESYDACAIREVGEELGRIPDRPLEKLFKLPASLETGWEFVWVYRVTYNGPFVLHPEEIESGEWFETDEVNRWLLRTPKDFASAFRLVWQETLAWLEKHHPDTGDTGS